MFEETYAALRRRQSSTQHHVHNHKTEVHEHRAPTDDSIRILREMEAKARENVIASFPFANNLFEGRVFVGQDFAEMNVHLFVRFTLNGNLHEVKLESKRFQSTQDMLKHVTAQLADYLASQVLAGLFTDDDIHTIELATAHGNAIQGVNSYGEKLK